MTADDFRAIRKHLGMTQEKMARALDVSVSSIHNYEGSRKSGQMIMVGDGIRIPQRYYKIPRRIKLACEALLIRFDVVKLPRS